MAVAARPPAAGSPTGLKVGFVVFVCLTVASLAGTVMLYMNQEQLTQQAEAAKKSAETASQKEQDARQALSAFAMQILGKQAEDPAEITTGLDNAAATIFGKDAARATDIQKQLAASAQIKRNDPFVTTLTSLYKAYDKQVAGYQALQADADTLKADLEAKTKELDDVQKQFTAQAEEIKAELADLQTRVDADQQAWDENVSRLRQQAQAEGEKASEQLRSERRDRQALEQQLAQNKTRISELVATLATFRPSAETTSLLQISDGYIVQTVPGQRIVYINLGKQDHIKPGMTFAVYSRAKGIPADGKGKATLRVNNIFDTTSECEITTLNAGDPIVEGDVIANPVYDRDRKFNFVVAGDFDLDYDGKIDDPAGNQVRRMIEDWGGSLQDSVDTTTDFVVLGAAPSSIAGAATDSAAGARKQFEAIKQEARSLGIPVLTRTQFLHFVGFGVPRNAKDSAI